MFRLHAPDDFFAQLQYCGDLAGRLEIAVEVLKTSIAQEAACNTWGRKTCRPAIQIFLDELRSLIRDERAPRAFGLMESLILAIADIERNLTALVAASHESTRKHELAACFTERWFKLKGMCLVQLGDGRPLVAFGRKAHGDSIVPVDQIHHLQEDLFDCLLRSEEKRNELLSFFETEDAARQNTSVLHAAKMQLLACSNFARALLVNMHAKPLLATLRRQPADFQLPRFQLPLFIQQFCASFAELDNLLCAGSAQETHTCELLENRCTVWVKRLQSDAHSVAECLEKDRLNSQHAQSCA